MAIETITNTTATTATGASATSLNKLSGDYNSFLKLLTAQISNQDPLKPMDSTTFVTQLAQLSQVEQSVTTNANLESIAQQLSGVGSLAGLGLLGRDVVAPSNMITTDGNGGPVHYRLAAPANSVTLTIRDAQGSIVRVLKELPSSDGTLNRADWDGMDYEGAPVPDGIYSAELEALDNEGNVIASQAYTKAKVERLSFSQGIATLELANGEIVTAGMVETIE
ncbi:hypothetical protein ATO6_20300 [Oceanicola sp. 22II-s10i]|uniref:flagellar hook assembly protein FlgD n=1 Tax=Oceanicola sp. 22II-s10i TaxID=1317116 RepID=UPI000B522158|nr:flagellar hook assembly protein FlgD [Oceanicola sp. 22II-s10i]OWU83184.1 hypothetical protein ATO6_20300 [Oceanicola sp. 22II-s10i]